MPNTATWTAASAAAEIRAWADYLDTCGLPQARGALARIVDREWESRWLDTGDAVDLKDVPPQGVAYCCLGADCEREGIARVGVQEDGTDNDFGGGLLIAYCCDLDDLGGVSQLPAQSRLFGALEYVRLNVRASEWWDALGVQDVVDRESVARIDPQSAFIHLNDVLWRTFAQIAQAARKLADVVEREASHA